MRNFGFTDYDEVSGLGTNGKMSEASAAMGLTSLESADEFIAVNRRNYLAYRRRLDWGSRARARAVRRERAQQLPVRRGGGRSGTRRPDRDQIQRLLWAENVVARRYFYPGCHRMEPYRSMSQYQDLALHATDALTSRVLCLPTGTAVDVGNHRGDLRRDCLGRPTRPRDLAPGPGRFNGTALVTEDDRVHSRTTTIAAAPAGIGHANH